PANTTVRLLRFGNRESCFSSHEMFLFVSVNEAAPAAITKAFGGMASAARHCALSCGLKMVVSIPGGITRTPPQAFAIGLRPAISASQWPLATKRAPHFL